MGWNSELIKCWGSDDGLFCRCSYFRDSKKEVGNFFRKEPEIFLRDFLIDVINFVVFSRVLSFDPFLYMRKASNV